MRQNLHILVVDDDRDNADSLAELFEVEGHTAEVAYCGEDAIAKFGEQHFDLAFMDVMMPGRNGVESFLEIRRLNPKAKVYMMTGFTVEQLLQQALDNGALGVLTKPVDPVKIMAALENAKPNTMILVADDDPSLSERLHAVIKTSGRSCQLVRDSAEIKSNMDLSGADCLILDLRLPLINSIEVFSKLNRRQITIPTIMITASRDNIQDALELLDDIEVTGILTKPFDPAELLERLTKLAA